MTIVNSNAPKENTSAGTSKQGCFRSISGEAYEIVPRGVINIPFLTM